jgi:glycosyltransferase involved in cell wall biosynthesis
MPGSTRSYELAVRLVEKGHQVYMVTSKRDFHQGRRANWTKENGINVCWIPVSYSNNMGFIRRIASFLIFSIKSIIVSLSLRVDLVFATSTPLTIAIPGIVYTKIKQIPMVFEVRDLWPEIPIALGAIKSKLWINLARWLEKIAYQNAKSIIALSKGMQQGIVRTGYPKSKTNIITNLSNTEKFGSKMVKKDLNIPGYDWQNHNPLVIYTGAFGHVNDVQYLIKIAGEMKSINSSVNFIIAGDGAHAETINRLATDNDVLNKSVFIIEPIDKRQIPHLYARASVVTSLFINQKELWHNSANKFFDGLAAEKPIMINYSGWQRDILEKHNAGFYVPYDDSVKGAEKLNQLLINPDLQKKMGHEAKRLAEEHFSIRVQFPKFEQVLISAVNQST